MLIVLTGIFHSLFPGKSIKSVIHQHREETWVSIENEIRVRRRNLV